MVEPAAQSADATCPRCGCLLWFPAGVGETGIPGFLRCEINDDSIATSAEAIAAILERLIEIGAVEAEQRKEIYSALLKRESLGSTGIGNGIAVPHARCSSVSGVVGAVSSFSSGIEFESLDGEPVFRVFLFVSAPDQQLAHLRTLERISTEIRREP